MENFSEPNDKLNIPKLNKISLKKKATKNGNCFNFEKFKEIENCKKTEFGSPKILNIDKSKNQEIKFKVMNYNMSYISPQSMLADNKDENSLCNNNSGKYFYFFKSQTNIFNTSYDNKNNSYDKSNNGNENYICNDGGSRNQIVTPIANLITHFETNKNGTDSFCEIKNQYEADSITSNLALMNNKKVLKLKNKANIIEEKDKQLKRKMMKCKKIGSLKNRDSFFNKNTHEKNKTNFDENASTNSIQEDNFNSNFKTREIDDSFSLSLAENSISAENKKNKKGLNNKFNNNFKHKHNKNKNSKEISIFQKKNFLTKKDLKNKSIKEIFYLNLCEFKNKQPEEYKLLISEIEKFNQNKNDGEGFVLENPDKIVELNIAKLKNKAFVNNNLEDPLKKEFTMVPASSKPCDKAKIEQKQTDFFIEISENLYNINNSNGQNPLNYINLITNRCNISQDYALESENQTQIEQNVVRKFRLMKRKLQNLPRECSIGRMKYKMFSAEEKNFCLNLLQFFDHQAVANMCNVPLKSLKRWSVVGAERKKGGGRKVKDPDMEFRIVNWIKQQQKQGIYINAKSIKEQALKYATNETFLASKGWLEKLKKKYHIHLPKKNNFNHGEN